MKKASFLVTESIPGIAAKDEIVQVHDNGILVGRWLPISEYPKLMKNRRSLRAPTEKGYSPQTRPPRRP
jgi:hypothetical protein